MVRIAITAVAFEAVAAALPLGSVFYEAQLDMSVPRMPALLGTGMDSRTAVTLLPSNCATGCKGSSRHPHPHGRAQRISGSRAASLPDMRAVF